MSGMRQGEILGLKWTDIDWFNCQGHVKRTFNHDHFYQPKSETSKRSIDLGPPVPHRRLFNHPKTWIQNPKDGYSYTKQYPTYIEGIWSPDLFSDHAKWHCTYRS